LYRRPRNVADDGDGSGRNIRVACIEGLMSSDSCSLVDLRDRDPGMVVVDAQKAFASEAGSLAVDGVDVSAPVETIPKLRNLVIEARGAGLPIVFTRSVRRADGRDAPGHNLSFVPAVYRNRDPICIEGTTDVEYVDGIDPAADEYEVTKLRYDGFNGTKLEARLRTEGVETVVLCGFMTNGCVEATARTAYERGFDVVLVEDCAASMSLETHAAAVDNVETLLGVAPTSDEIRFE
jgi:nicotinamidase-related amidase